MKDVAVVRAEEFLQHVAPPGHPEHEGRLRACLELFAEDAQLAALPQIAPRDATEAELLGAHSATMVRAVLTEQGREGWFDADTYYCPASVHTAQRAVGTTVAAALAVAGGTYRRAMSFVRPPGHHATHEAAMGFCLFNSVACAVATVRNAYPNQRVAVVDFDVHHGNGTQDIFWKDPNVLFVSSHRRPFYPGSGGVDEVGEGAGAGTTVNLPFGRPIDDEAFLAVYRSVVVPVLDAFAPDLLVVSAGFDGHRDDPMRGLLLTEDGFGRVAELLLQSMERRSGKALFSLEGGYDLAALKASSGAVLRKLLEVPRTVVAAPAVSDAEAPQRFRKHFANYFPELR